MTAPAAPADPEILALALVCVCLGAATGALALLAGLAWVMRPAALCAACQRRPPYLISEAPGPWRGLGLCAECELALGVRP